VNTEKSLGCSNRCRDIVIFNLLEMFQTAKVASNVVEDHWYYILVPFDKQHMISY